MFLRTYKIAWGRSLKLIYDYESITDMSDTALSLCNMNGNGISGYGSFAFHAFIDGSSPIS